MLGERVANGFTLEIHDRGLGMAADALLDANLRLAETPEFELSDTDRLGLFVVSRLAQRQNVRVSLQPSPYGGTTAVVFIPDALLTDDVPDTNGIGFRLDRPRPSKEAELRGQPQRRALPGARTAAPACPPRSSTARSSWRLPSTWTPSDDFPGRSTTRTANAADCSARAAPSPAPRTTTASRRRAPHGRRTLAATRRADADERRPVPAAPPPDPQAGQLARSPGHRTAPRRRAETDEQPATARAVQAAAPRRRGQEPARSAARAAGRGRAAARRRGTGAADGLGEPPDAPAALGIASRETGGRRAPACPTHPARRIASSGTAARDSATARQPPSGRRARPGAVGGRSGRRRRPGWDERPWRLRSSRLGRPPLGTGTRTQAPPPAPPRCPAAYGRPTWPRS